MKKKLLVVSYRPIYGMELLKKEIEEVFSDLFEIIHLIIKDEENILISQEYLNPEAVYYTADTNFSIISRTRKYFEEDVPIARNFPRRDGYMEIENVGVFINHIDVKNFFIIKLNF